jgi:hypothetical protein
MFSKPLIGRDEVFINDTEGLEADKLGVLVLPKRKGVPSFKPPMVKMPALIASSNPHHKI